MEEISIQKMFKKPWLWVTLKLSRCRCCADLSAGHQAGSEGHAGQDPGRCGVRPVLSDRLIESSASQAVEVLTIERGEDPGGKFSVLSNTGLHCNLVSPEAAELAGQSAELIYSSIIKSAGGGLAHHGAD